VYKFVSRDQFESSKNSFLTQVLLRPVVKKLYIKLFTPDSNKIAIGVLIENNFS